MSDIMNTWLQAGFSCALAVGAWVGVACAHRAHRAAKAQHRAKEQALGRELRP